MAASDHYEEYYAQKLWAMIPSIYRIEDGTPQPSGPLEEIVARIGGQAAVIRRSIDRLWEDQSIETCDDWIIPYIGKLLATRLVAIDTRAQRLDVAKTVYYRRRKGTLGLLEELASDISGREAKVVEFFRRLGRTRHQFDPAIGLVPRGSKDGWVSAADPLSPAPLQFVAGLVGRTTHTPAGGYADLRHHHGATRVMSAFDEFAHTADFRRGRQFVGWHNIPRLGSFVWWMSTYKTRPTTPVKFTACPEQFTFDPTGREIPLFGPSGRADVPFGEGWTSPDEVQLPVKISKSLFAQRPEALYPAAFSVLEGDTAPYVQMSYDRALVNVERGVFRLTGAPPSGGKVHVCYHYGFNSEIGAGPYDQRRGLSSIRLPSPIVRAPVPAAIATGTIEFGDSLTYQVPPNLLAIDHVAIVATNKERPVIRSAGTARPVWIIEGAVTDEAPGATLLLQGIHVAGVDIVLRGRFDSVRLRCMTLDPGTSGADLDLPVAFTSAADERPLWPTRLFIEGSIERLMVERSITSSIRTRGSGAIAQLNVSDSIVQALPEALGGLFNEAAIYDPALLALRLKFGADPLSAFLRGKLSAEARGLIDGQQPRAAATSELTAKLAVELNAILVEQLYDPVRFASVPLSTMLREEASAPWPPPDPVGLNRKLLQQAFPIELGDVALGTTSGTVELVRTTVLGPAAIHRLNANETIFDELVIVTDPQHGCVRFCAYPSGSRLHQPYRSVATEPGAALFRTRRFGQPDYAALLSGADGLIVEGAENGSEIGAFSRELTPLRRRGLSQKFAEYMSIGLVPIVVDAS